MGLHAIISLNYRGTIKVYFSLEIPLYSIYFKPQQLASLHIFRYQDNSEFIFLFQVDILIPTYNIAGIRNP